MAKQRSGDRCRTPGTAIGRRDFVKTSAAAGLGAATLFPGQADAQGQAAAPAGVSPGWNYEFDVVVVGAACAGLTAAIRARDLGATVLVVSRATTSAAACCREAGSSRPAAAIRCSGAIGCGRAMPRGASRPIRSSRRRRSTTASICCSPTSSNGRSSVDAATVPTAQRARSRAGVGGALSGDAAVPDGQQRHGAGLHRRQPRRHRVTRSSGEGHRHRHRNGLQPFGLPVDANACPGRGDRAVVRAAGTALPVGRPGM